MEGRGAVMPRGAGPPFTGADVVRNWRTYVVAGVTLAFLALAGWLALPHLPPTVRVWERSNLRSAADTPPETVFLGAADSAGAGAGATVLSTKVEEETAARSAARVVHVAVVIGPMLRVPTRAVAPEPVPPPDPFAAALAKELITGPARTAFGTPVVTLPELANRPEVTRALRRMYPSELRRAGAAGTSVIRLRIDEDGRVIRRYVVATCGNVLLDRAAISSASLMRFVPARFEGKAVRSEVDIPVTFAVVTVADTTTRARAADTAAHGRARETARPTGSAGAKTPGTATPARTPSRNTPARSGGTAAPAP